MARLDQLVGEADYNDIFASATPTAHVATIELAASQGTLKRGTLVTGTAGGEMSAVSAALDTNPAYVLAEDVDTGTDEAVTVIAYKTGNFRREALVTSSYTMTDADWENLRAQGILTTDSL